MADDTHSFKRRGLGRGLSALIMDTQRAQPQPPEPESAAGIRQLRWDSILPNPRQPRAQFDSGALEELAASIREHGIIQPLIVTQQPHQPDAYWLIAGERRWRAAQLAELDSVPALVREASPQ